MSDARPIQRWHNSPAEYGGRVQFPFLDEFVAHNVDIHYEAMSDTSFWMLVKCRETGREWHLNFGAINSRARGYAMAEEDTLATTPTPDETTESEGSR